MFGRKIYPLQNGFEPIVLDGSKNIHLVSQFEGSIQPLLDRFYLNLENVVIRDVMRSHVTVPVTSQFISHKLENMAIAGSAIAALGTMLNGGYGSVSKEMTEGMDKELLKEYKNTQKKYGDQIATFMLHEALYVIGQHLPENTVILSAIGEGAIAKAGESQEMGGNPQLGYGRVYGREGVCKKIEPIIQRGINDPTYSFEQQKKDIEAEGIHVICLGSDPLEGTSRYAEGKSTGSMVTWALFNQLLNIRNKYEAYIHSLIMPAQVANYAKNNPDSYVDVSSTPEEVVDLLVKVFKIKPEQILSWGLRGESRNHRVSRGEAEYEKLGVHLLNDQDVLMTGHKAVTDSGSMTPFSLVVNTSNEKNPEQIFMIREYGASAESLMTLFKAYLLDMQASGQMLSSLYKLPTALEAKIFAVEPPEVIDATSINFYFEKLKKVAAGDPAFEKFTVEMALEYAQDYNQAKKAGYPVGKPFKITDIATDPDQLDGIAIDSFISTDAYSNLSGVKKVAEDTYEVSTRVYLKSGIKDVVLTFKAKINEEHLKKVFTPLLIRFLKGEDYQNRRIKYRDYGRIKIELLESYAQGVTPKNGSIIFDPNLFYEVKIGEKKISAKYYFSHESFPLVRRNLIIQNHSYQEIKKLMEILSWFKENSGGSFDYLKILPFNKALEEILSSGTPSESPKPKKQ